MRLGLIALLGVMSVGCAASPSAPAPVDFRGAKAPQSAPSPQRQPAPIERRTPQTPAASQAPIAPPAPRPHPQTAAPDWADGPGTPLSVWALQPEEAHPVDPANPPKAHEVKAGETLYSISLRYQIPLRPIIDLNRLAAPFALAEGQVLALPPPRLHRVAQGETLVALARRYNIDARSLALLNRLTQPYALKPGDVIVLPAMARASGAPHAAPSVSRHSPAPAPPGNAASPMRFAWPLKGNVLARFGAQPGGRRSDGLDIQAETGVAVQAAAPGRVVYADDDLEGYGKLMLIQHDGGWVTAYAHLGQFAVREGARVKQGDPIGQAGAQRVHFQIRRSGEPTDPIPLLPRA